jgi:hypothetical protein
MADSRVVSGRGQHRCMEDPSWPFVGSEALAGKALPERAMRKWYQPVYPGVFAPRDVALTPEQRAHAAWLWSGRRAVVAGQSAAVLLGAKWADPLHPPSWFQTTAAHRR